MKKIITSALLVSAFAFVGCSGKKTACECMEMAPGMMMKVMSGSMSQEEAEKEMEACNWMDELTEEERLAAIEECGGDISAMAKDQMNVNAEEAEKAAEELVQAIEDAINEADEESDSLEIAF